MLFARLAKYLSELEATASRNLMVEILAKLFGEAKEEEIGKIVYLTQGRVAPLYEPVEFGMADKMAIKALSRTGDWADDEVVKEYKLTGDLGDVAELLKSKIKSSLGLARDGQKSKNLGVGDSFSKLYQLTQTVGEGSVDKKIELLSELLGQSDALSAKYIVRIVLDKLRLGFSDMTILEALSWMIDGTKKHKDTIEAGYNVRPDLGYIAEEIKRGGIRGIRDVRPRAGTPILPMRAERLASATEILEKTGGRCAAEPKLDGLRTQLHLKRNKELGIRNYGREGKGTVIRNSSFLIRLFSRGLENVTAMYPDLCNAAMAQLDADEVILDGEAIGFNPKTGVFVGFQQTTQRKRKHDVEAFAKDVPVKLVVFDCLFLNGESLINKPYKERREIVENLLSRHSGKPALAGASRIGPNQHDVGGKIIILAEMKIVGEESVLQKFFDHCVSLNLEGIMAKKLDGVYQAGARGWNWIKLKGSYTESKLADTIDAVVMGLDYGQGKRSGFGVGAFLVGVYNQRSDSYKTISKIGTGLTDEEWKKLKAKSEELKVKEKPKNYDVDKIMNCDVWLKPKIVGEFRCDELTKSPMHTAGLAMRFPRLEKWREDKKPEDATTLSELEKMASRQGTTSTTKKHS